MLSHRMTYHDFIDGTCLAIFTPISYDFDVTVHAIR
jgi:hypothetical protein